MHNAVVKKRNLTITSMTAVLLATVAISILLTDDASARNQKYSDDNSQAASVSNSCLNPVFESNTIDNVIGVGNCAGTVSQQEESGQASTPITHQTANPTIEVQRATTTQPPLTGGTCAECFVPLNSEQVTEFESRLPGPLAHR